MGAQQTSDDPFDHLGKSVMWNPVVMDSPVCQFSAQKASCVHVPETTLSLIPRASWEQCWAQQWDSRNRISKLLSRVHQVLDAMLALGPGD